MSEQEPWTRYWSLGEALKQAASEGGTHYQGLSDGLRRWYVVYRFPNDMAVIYPTYDDGYALAGWIVIDKQEYQLLTGHPLNP